MSSSLSPAHALLAIGLRAKPVQDALTAAEAWIALDSMQAGRQADGETDLTVFLKHLPDMMDLREGKDDRADWIVAQLDRLTQRTSLFEPNAEGVTGWDLLQARESLTLTRWWLMRPDRPALAELMQRPSPVPTPAATNLKVPTVWAAWALQDRGDELLEVKAADPLLTWPTDVLGWAHPQLATDLLDEGAPWNAQVKELWATRQRVGQLTHKEAEKMRLRCAVTLDQDLSQIQSAAWRNGADVIKSVKSTKDSEHWLGLLQEAGDVSAFTAPYKVVAVTGTHTQDVPLAVRLMALLVSDELTQAKIPGVLQLMTQGWPQLGGDPLQPAPGVTHTMGTLAHTVALHLEEGYKGLERSKQRPALNALGSWRRAVVAWAGPMNWAHVVACADDLDHHGPGLLFSNANVHQSFQRSVNAHGLREADRQLQSLSLLSPETIQVPVYQPHLTWVHWAIARVQQPGQNRGVLTTPTSHLGFEGVLDPHGRSPIQNLFKVMTTEQKLVMMTAFFLGNPDETAFSVSKQVKGAEWAQARWEQASEGARRRLKPMLERLAQGEGKNWPAVVERAIQTLAEWTAAARQTQALDVTPVTERRRPRPRT